MWYPDDFERLASLSELLIGWCRVQRLSADNASSFVRTERTPLAKTPAPGPAISSAPGVGAQAEG